MSKSMLSRVMAQLGRIKSPAKAAASRKNGGEGGRPKGAKDKKPRKQRAKLVPENSSK